MLSSDFTHGLPARSIASPHERSWGAGAAVSNPPAKGLLLTFSALTSAKLYIYTCQGKERGGWFCVVGAGPGQGEGTGLAAAHSSRGRDPAWPLPCSGLRGSCRGRKKEKLWCCGLKILCLLGIFIACLLPPPPIWLSCCKVNVFPWLLSGEPLCFLSLLRVTWDLFLKYFSLASSVASLSETGVFP